MMTKQTNNRRVDSALGLSRARRPQTAAVPTNHQPRRQRFSRADSAVAVPAKLEDFKVKLFMDNIPVYVRPAAEATLAAD